MFALLLPTTLALAGDPPGDTEDDDAGEVLVVTGSRTERPLSASVVATDVVTREEIEASGASDASEVLETLPGISITRSFRGAGVRMQGLDPQYTLVLVDGERMIGQTDGVLDLSRIPAERIERIEIVKGASSALYGSDAVAGVINIITREPNAPFESQTVGSWGSRNTIDASEHLGFRRERWSLAVDGGAHTTDGYDWDPGDAQTDGDRVREANVGGSLGYAPTRELGFDLDGSYRIADSRGVDASGSAIFDRRNLSEEASTRLGTDAKGAHARSQLHATASTYRDQYALDQRGGTDLDDYEDSREALVQLDAQRDQVWDRHVLSVGVEGTRNTLTSPRLSEDGLRWRGALFAQDEWNVLGARRLTLVPSARLDADSWFGLHPTPRFAARWDVRRDLALRVNAGWGFRAPTFKEMFLFFENPSAGYQVAGNPDLEPETSVGVSGGGEWAPAARVQLRLDGWYTELHDLITIDFVDDGATAAEYGYVNVASAWTTGGEVDLSFRVGSALTSDLGYTYTRTYDRELERPLDGRAPHRGTFGFTWRSSPCGCEAVARGEVVGPTSFFLDEDGDGTEEEVLTDPYANVKLRLEKTVLPRPWSGSPHLVAARLRLFVGVDNVTDAGDALYIHLDPRTFYGGLIVDLPEAE